MNLPNITSYEDRAVNAVVTVINRAREALGERQTLKQFASSRDTFFPRAKVTLITLKNPLVITSEELINNIIVNKWNLTEYLTYSLKYDGSSKDECSQYYYFEAIFSQPTSEYPVPQATASVFFRVEDKQIDPPEVRGVPKMTFRVEGHRVDHDVRYVMLVPDWILAVIQMKIKLFRRIESIQMF